MHNVPRPSWFRQINWPFQLTKKGKKWENQKLMLDRPLTGGAGLMPLSQNGPLEIKVDQSSESEKQKKEK